jgi:hypothetical protein
MGIRCFLIDFGMGLFVCLLLGMLTSCSKGEPAAEVLKLEGASKYRFFE